MLDWLRHAGALRPSSPSGAARRNGALGVAAAVAPGVHALILLCAAWKPSRAARRVRLQVEAPTEPAGAPTGGAAAPLRAQSPCGASARRPARAVARVPVARGSSCARASSTDEHERGDPGGSGPGGFPGFEDRREYFAVAIARTFRVSEAGSFRFRLESADRAQLFIDNRLVVDNDGIHGAISRRGEVELRSGRHQIRLWYLQGMR
ncbi:MAG: PA14 domain-containing protein [Deltaproteobacteria bacterium]